MSNDQELDTRLYAVVTNHEEQYSIWPLEKALPAGWKAEGKQGQKDECIEYIDRTWTDMRPLSLRKAMEQDAQANA